MTTSHNKKLCLTLLLLGLLCLQSFAHPEGEEDYEHHCNHDEIQDEPELHDVDEDMSTVEDSENTRSLASKTYNNIRIYPYFGYLESTASSSYATYIKNDVVAPIIDYFEAAFKVKYPVSGNLKLTSSKICERSTPSVLKSGVSADLFIYFDSEAVSGTQIASAKYCYLASGSKRPIVSRAMINRNMMKVTSDIITHERNMMTLMHELMHTLGISTYLFKYYLDGNGKTRTGHIKSVKIAGSTRTVIDVAPLTQKLRDYYGCSSLQGLVMEDDGGSGTAVSHFERKFFPYEAMSSGSINGRRISEFSLALLEGSGWYIPNYSYAEPFFYGKGQGCSFITGSCSSSKSSFKEFCTGSTRGCAPHGRGGGSCSSDSLMDGCRWHKPSSSYDCDNPNAASGARLPSLQVFGRGAGSKCFTGTLNSKSSTSATSFCFKYTCSGSGSSTKLNVQVGKNSITCSKEGKVSVKGYYGTIDCPNPRTFCDTVGKKYCVRNCMGRGTCSNGVCKCKSGYKGVDCGLKA